MKKILLIILLNLFILVGCTKENAKEADVTPILAQFEVDIVAVGDNLIHDTVYQAASIGEDYNFKPYFSEIKPYIQSFDLAFVNQESITGGKEIGLSTYPCFNSPYEVGDALVDTGFNLISIANNHTLDRGEKAVLNAINYWKNQDVVFSGAVEDENFPHVKLFSKKGIRFAFVAYTYGTNGIKHPNGKLYLANTFSEEKAKNDILAVRDSVDIVIVSMHWGIEYENYPSKLQKSQARFLASLGADIIIGHHPHVIQPVEMIMNKNRQTFVIYSLGNFLSDQKGIDRLIGMAASIKITKKVFFGKTSIELQNPEAKLLYRHKDFFSNQFNVKLFQDLTEEFLKDYRKYYSEKEALIKYYYQDIKVS